MQPQKTHDSDEGGKRDGKVQQSNLLLIGGEDGFREINHHLFFGQRFRIAGRATTLLEGLFCLESEAIDVALLSREFREDEISLFASAAQGRGYTGLILHVAFFPSGKASSDGRGDQHGGTVEVQEKPDSYPSKRHHDAPGVDGLRGAISFTTKEKAVLTRVSEGWSNHQIASHLKCTEGSVKAIVQQLFDKLGVRKRTQIVRLAFEWEERGPIHDLDGQSMEDENHASAAPGEGLPAESHRVQVELPAAPARPAASRGVRRGRRDRD
jgi:DNA-binding CsgD family transcriptional regulator